MLGMFPQTWALPKVGKVQGEHFSWRKATGKGYRLPHPSPTPIDQYSNFMHIFNLNLKSKVYCQLPPILSKNTRMSQSRVLSHVKHRNAHGLGPLQHCTRSLYY